jgi:hypothetical protein
MRLVTHKSESFADVKRHEQSTTASVGKKNPSLLPLFRKEDSTLQYSTLQRLQMPKNVGGKAAPPLPGLPQNQR